ncbi:MAG TPA: T9SS type A sorting domain-containing protein, partial [Flavobacteriales bacterium]|nr:T9SS type A sorting domain-containing protein [Flavobacteriales bacterium]
NVPLGLTYEASSPNFTFYPQQNQFGCLRICGTPLVAGPDTIQVIATAQGTVGGVNTTTDYTIPIPVLVLPAAEENAGFSAPPDTACAPFVFDPDPLITAPGYNITYDWSFGNGNTYAGADPPTQTYTVAGEYVIDLNTTVSAPVLTQLAVTGVNDAWCGDLDEIDFPLIGCTGQPDIYFVIIDARLGTYRSSVANNTQSHTWGGLMFPLVHPPFTIKVYDSDNLSADDLLGTFSIGATAGDQPFSAGGTSGSAHVQTETIASLHNTDSVFVVAQPNTTLQFSQGVLCATDMTLANYVWEVNGAVVEGSNGPCVLASNGFWSVTGTSAAGCSSSSTYDLLTLGLNDHHLASAVISPMPTRGVFTVRLAEWSSAPINVEVVDLLGKTMHTERRNPIGGALSFDLSGFANGSYLLRLSNGTVRVVRPLIISERD